MRDSPNPKAVKKEKKALERGKNGIIEKSTNIKNSSDVENCYSLVFVGTSKKENSELSVCNIRFGRMGSAQR